MNESEIRRRADERFEAAIRASGARDPREFYRGLLRQLRERDESTFRTAVDYYERTLVPAVARADSDPLGEWLEYGKLLAELISPGETVRIDASGRSRPYEPPVDAAELVLHLPDSSRERAIAIGIPPELSQAQRATYDLLVERKTE